MSRAAADPAIDLLDPAVQESPYETYRTLREVSPVHHDPRTGYFVLSRYADVRAALSDTERFSNDMGNAATRQIHPERAERVRALYQAKGWLPARSLAGYDDPRHCEIRTVFTQAFRAGRIKQLDGFVARTADGLVDDFASRGRAEIVRELSVPLPLIVIGQQMGVPREDIWQIKHWTDAWVKRLGMMLSEAEELETVELEIEAQHYFKAIYERLRAKPDDTVLSDLVNTPIGDRPLRDNELHAHMMADTFVGGSETTTNALSAGVRLLIENPEQYKRLKADLDQHLRTFIEEVLRLESPVQGLFRVTTTDVELHGVTIPKGAVVNVRYAAANRDPEQFPEPDRLDLERRNSATHLAFGTGTHHCIGAPLARHELHHGFRALLSRVRDLRLAPDAPAPEHVPNFCLRALRELHVEFDS